jgi:hypothetical protein
MKCTNPKVRLKALAVGHKVIMDDSTSMRKISSAAIRSTCSHFAVGLNWLEALAQEV